MFEVLFQVRCYTEGLPSQRLSHYEEHDGFKEQLLWIQGSSYSGALRLKCFSTNTASSLKQQYRSYTGCIFSAEAIPDPEPPTKKHCGFFSSLVHVPVNDINTQSSIKLEIQEYLSTPCLPEESDPLSFLEVTHFPTLSLLARNFLCIPASSAHVERLFSIVGKIFRPERCRLR